MTDLVQEVRDIMKRVGESQNVHGRIVPQEYDDCVVMFATANVDADKFRTAQEKAQLFWVTVFDEIRKSHKIMIPADNRGEVEYTGDLSVFYNLCNITFAVRIK